MHRFALAALLLSGLALPARANLDPATGFGITLAEGYAAQARHGEGFDSVFAISRTGGELVCMAVWIVSLGSGRTQDDLNAEASSPGRRHELSKSLGDFEIRKFDTFTLNSAVGNEVIGAETPLPADFDILTYSAALETPAGTAMLICSSPANVFDAHLSVYRQVRDGLIVPTTR